MPISDSAVLATSCEIIVWLVQFEINDDLMDSRLNDSEIGMLFAIDGHASRNTNLNLIRRRNLSFLFVVICLTSQAQILDDSTVLVYGPTTTKWVVERQILNNQDSPEEYATVDTALYRFDRVSLVDRSGRRFQNLGNFGTAAFPVFFDPQATIGRTTGFNAFAPYSRSGLDIIKYYDTKSPFIDLFTYIGGGNKNMVNVDFSRNVREGWNLGFDIHKITADKLIGRDAVADRQTVNTAFDLYTHYKHQKIPYQALVYYSKLTHEVAESGGVRYGSDSLLSELFQRSNAQLQLEDAQNKRSESTLHLYHDYRIAPQFQIYHSLDLYNEENIYQDYEDGSSIDDYDTYSDAYDVFLIDPDSTSERARFSSFTNEAGIKGDLANIFYRGYVKVRTLDFDYFLLDPIERTTETYIGGYARFSWREKFDVVGEAEVMQAGEYSFGGSLRSDVANVAYTSRRYRVPFIYQSYFGNHYEWDNGFTPVFVNRLSADARLHYKFLTLIPKVILTTYNDFVYFDQEMMPQQASEGIAITSVGGEVNAVLENRKGEAIVFENEVFATNVSGGSADAVRIPQLFHNGRYYWRGNLFDDKVPVQIGFDTHARTSYFANDYDPVTQQFFLQDDFEVTGYFKADFFITMRLDKFYLGLKWVHADQQADDGYFMGPFYPGQRRAIDLMVRWTFFD